ncbi:protein of unknown function [Burkholderia multivorans]
MHDVDGATGDVRFVAGVEHYAEGLGVFFLIKCRQRTTLR